MVVSTLRPFLTAAMLLPLPRWQVMALTCWVGLPSILAAVSTRYLWLQQHTRVYTQAGHRGVWAQQEGTGACSGKAKAESLQSVANTSTKAPKFVACGVLKTRHATPQQRQNVLEWSLLERRKKQAVAFDRPQYRRRHKRLQSVIGLWAQTAKRDLK